MAARRATAAGPALRPAHSAAVRPPRDACSPRQNDARGYMRDRREGRRLLHRETELLRRAIDLPLREESMPRRNAARIWSPADSASSAAGPRLAAARRGHRRSCAVAARALGCRQHRVHHARRRAAPCDRPREVRRASRRQFGWQRRGRYRLAPPLSVAAATMTT